MRIRRQRPLHDGGFSVFDTFLDQVANSVGLLPVETGGAILGDYTSGVVTRFIFDAHAETTAASYTPSRRLGEVVNQAEHESRLQFKGIVHSHPGNFDVPSGPDAAAFLQGLTENPELPRFLAPIVTFQPGEERDNKIPLPGGGWITFYVAMREGRHDVRIERTMPDIIHFGRDCRALCTVLGRPAPEFLNGHNGNVSTVTAVISLTDDLELMLTADGSYPNSAPQAILHRPSREQTTQLHLRWSAVVGKDLRLLHSLAARGTSPEAIPTGMAFGSDGRVMTLDEDVAASLGLEPVLVADDFDRHRNAVEEGLFARSKGLLSETLRNRTVLLNGAGSVGSYIAEQLVRSGVGSLMVIDPDTVEYANLSRTVYTADDVGRLKVDALARRLLSISPSLRIRTVPMDIHHIDEESLREMYGSADLVVCAVDDRRAQMLINHWAYHNRKPAVYVGIYAGARSGEVLYCDPPLACFKCATPFRNEIPEEDQRSTDYGTGDGRLVAEVAIGADIQAITAAGVRLTLSRLVQGHESSLASFVSELGGKQFAMLAVDPNVEIVNAVLNDAVAQYGYKSAWFNLSKAPDCNVCGENPDSPRATAHVSSSDLRQAILMSSDEGAEEAPEASPSAEAQPEPATPGDGADSPPKTNDD
jgi:molybdopterin/thiamine biosynthesis adenylyltransferase